ncbi:hypothetical protein LJC10_00400 [Selenomonadales bacterium OttesenSCG-928-I06]|nr:hypothetical protein [Selenomonadales bacterium OttesenSCG-928-I06]
MAYENGYKAESYLQECINAYKNDPMIFTKALQTIKFFSHLPTWPHNYNELVFSLKEIFRQNVEGILTFNQQFFDRFLLRYIDKLEWSTDTPNAFIQDLIRFYLSAHPLLEMADAARVTPLRFYALARSNTADSKTKMLKIIRMDGESLEFEVDSTDAKDIIRSLGLMFQL